MTTLKSIAVISILLTLILATGFTVAHADQTNGKIPITTNSEKARQFYLKGRDLAEKIRFEEAKEYYLKAVEADPKFALALFSLAFAGGSINESIEKLEMAKRYSANASEGERLLILATEASLNSDLPRRRLLLRQLVMSYPNDERAHNQLANQYFGQQEFQLAIEEYNKAIEINPDFSQPYNQLGYSYRFLGEYEAAESNFQKYIQLIPDDPNPYDSYAELLLKKGDFDESISMYQKALAVKPDFTPSHVGIATNQFLKGDYAVSRQTCDKLIKSSESQDTFEQMNFTKLLSYLHEDKSDNAEQIAEELYSVFSKKKQVEKMLHYKELQARIVAESGDMDRAEKLYREIIELAEGSDLPEVFLANIDRNRPYSEARFALARGQIDDAKQFSREYQRNVDELKIPGELRQAHQLKGLIAIEENEFSTAVKELEQTNKRDAYSLYYLAKAYQGLGDLKQARDTYYDVAHFNSINSFGYALVHTKALKALATM